MNSAKLFLAFRPLLCFSILLVCVLVADAGSRSAHSAPTKTRKQPFLETVDRVAPQSLKEFAVPGVAVGLIQKGEVAWARGYGFANVATAKPITPETVFNVGSLSKMATAWGVMRLVEEGKVDLDRPVDSYLKRWHLPPSSFDNSQVTVRRVLSHTSGISNHNFHGWDPQSPVPPIEDTLSGKTGTGEVRVVYAPGSGNHYSGANYAILQLLIEDVTGQAFQEVMATPYNGLGDVLPILRYNEFSAAGLTTTLGDLARLAAAELGDSAGQSPGRSVLKEQTVLLMQTAAPASRWADRDPYGPDPQYGLGHTVRPEQFLGKVGVGHGGSNSGWESLVQIVPSTGDGIVIMTNSSNGPSVIASLLCS